MHKVERPHPDNSCTYSDWLDWNPDLDPELVQQVMGFHHQIGDTRMLQPLAAKLSCSALVCVKGAGFNLAVC